MAFFGRHQHTAPPPVGAALIELVGHAHLELIPTPKAHLQFQHLPPNSTVSVTASPAKPLQATLDMSAELIDLGHTVIPHLAARMVDGPDHVARIAQWIDTHGVTQAFVIGGDAAEAAGPYTGAEALMRALLDSTATLHRIGFAGYPEGHATIPSGALAAALSGKQQLLDDAGVGGWVSTQMCFDPRAVTRWVAASRADGLHLPVHLGIPGVIDTMKLLTMGTRLGVGASLRYLRKNRRVVSKLAMPGGYDPMSMLAPLAADLDGEDLDREDLDGLDIEALHVFTFNQVAPTVAWQLAVGGGATFLDNTSMAANATAPVTMHHYPTHQHTS